MDLNAAMSREFSAAKLLWGVIVILQFVLLACSIAAASVTGNRLLLLGGALLIVPVASLLLRWRAETYHDRGEQMRRAYVLQNALGKDPEPASALAIAATGTNLPKVDPSPIGQYFSSALPLGTQRLAENLGESAFYTWRIAALTSYFCAALAIGGLSIAVLMLWWAVQVGIPSGPAGSGLQAAGLHLAKLFSDLFSFVAAGVFAELWWSYRSLSTLAERVFRDSLQLAQEKLPDNVAVFVTMGDYDGALAKTPPLPGTLKWLCNRRLAELWADHLSSRDRAST